MQTAVAVVNAKTLRALEKDSRAEHEISGEEFMSLLSVCLKP